MFVRRACVLFYDLLLCVCVLLGCGGCVLGLMVVCACLVGWLFAIAGWSGCDLCILELFVFVC